MGKCCCCNCLFNCACACVCQVLCAIVVLFAVVIAAIWVIFRPNLVTFHVANASLTKFEFSPASNALDYDFAFNVSIKNKNQRLGVYFDVVEARTLYHKQQFATTNLQPFFMERRNHTDVSFPPLKGSSVIKLEEADKKKYEDEKKSGVYEITTMLYMRIRFKSFFFKTGKFKMVAGCNLKVPLKSNNNSSSTPAFERTQCIVIPFAK